MKKIAVVGAGIFGCSIALELSKFGYEVDLYDCESDIMLRASKNNHNRIHYGYHYPRSVETARQSLEGLISFYSIFGTAIVDGFPNFYMISTDDSKVTTEEYKEFCLQSGLSYSLEFPDSSLINRELIDSSFKVEEPIFDWTILQRIAKTNLLNSSVRFFLNTDFRSTTLSYDFVVNSSFAGLNEVNTFLGADSVSMKYQNVVVPIFKHNMSKIGLTVMDGPFCSLMPKGKEQNLFLLYHVKESLMLDDISEVEIVDRIFENSRIYYPFLNRDMFVNLWKAERALPVNSNDERLSELFIYPDLNLVSVFSAKITTCVKIAKQIRVGLETGNFNNKFVV
jgi:hypothetical protein